MDYLVEAFAETRRWAKIVSIFFMVSFVLSLFSLFTDGIVAGMLNVFMSAFIYLLPGLFLFRYANAVAEAEDTTSPVEDLEIACLNQGRYFLVSGIVIAIGLVFFVLGVIAALVMGGSLLQSYGGM